MFQFLQLVCVLSVQLFPSISRVCHTTMLGFWYKRSQKYTDVNFDITWSAVQEGYKNGRPALPRNISDYYVNNTLNSQLLVDYTVVSLSRTLDVHAAHTKQTTPRLPASFNIGVVATHHTCSGGCCIESYCGNYILIVLMRTCVLVL